MTEYIVSSDEWGTVYHKSDADGMPRCGTNGVYHEATPEEVADRDLCKHCSGDATYDGEYPPDLTETLLDAVKDAWRTPRSLSENIDVTPNAIRRRLNELYQQGRVNRRSSVSDGSAPNGYEYSQQEIDQAGYEGNNRLFESMLGD